VINNGAWLHTTIVVAS